jgi:hypothetical protein
MASTLASRETDPHDIFVIEPDVVLAARSEPTLATAAGDTVAAAQVSSAATKPESVAAASASTIDSTFRVTAADKVNGPAASTMGRLARRAGLLCLLTLCSAAAVVGWKHYGTEAEALAARWMPKFALAASPPEQKADAAEQPPVQQALPVQQASATEQATVQPIAPAQPAPNAAQPAAVLPPETAQLLQSMSQQIAELKASVDQLKAGQALMSRELAKTTEARSAEPPKPVAARMAAPNLPPKLPPVHKPKPTYAPVQAAIAPPLPPPTSAPVTLQPRALPPPPPAEYTDDQDYGPVVRPPMPLR